MLGLPSKEAVAAIIISGADEPIATIVKPIIIGEMPKFLASDEAPKTNLSALHTKVTRETSKIRICINIKGSYIEGGKLSLVAAEKQRKIIESGEKNVKKVVFSMFKAKKH